MPLFKAQMSWSQFTINEIVEILDEDLPKFERAITPRSEGGLGRLKPYLEGDVIPAFDSNHWSAYTDEHPYAPPMESPPQDRGDQGDGGSGDVPTLDSARPAAPPPADEA